MAATAYTLCKKERLCGQRAIADLFASGDTFAVAPYKIFWVKTQTIDPYPSRFAVSVPKRRFKLAVKRNLMKRRTREVFRANKQILNSVVKDGQQIHLIVIYASDHLLPTIILDASMKKILQRIARQYAESN